MTNPELTDMSPEEFREWGHRSIDWIADYLSDLETRTVSPDVSAGSIRAQIPDMAPDAGEGMDRIFSDMEKVILPGVTHWNSPNFFAYFPSSASGPGILGELLMAAFNTNAMIWRTSPAATELEESVLNWLRQMLGLSDAFTGVVYDTASVSTFHAIAAARAAISERDIGEDGMAGVGAPRLCMYTSQEAHSSVEKAGIALGLGRNGVRKVGVDDRFRMDAVELEAAIGRDKADGWHPFCVSATVGTTSTTSVDPVEAIASVCNKHGLWLHVDGAYAAAAAILPEMRNILAGCEHAHSFVMNPHKWLFTPIDFSALFCRRPDMLKRAFSLTAGVSSNAGGRQCHQLYGLRDPVGPPLSIPEVLDGCAVLWRRWSPPPHPRTHSTCPAVWRMGRGRFAFPLAIAGRIRHGLFPAERD